MSVGESSVVTTSPYAVSSDNSTNKAPSAGSDPQPNTNGALGRVLLAQLFPTRFLAITPSTERRLLVLILNRTRMVNDPTLLALTHSFSKAATTRNYGTTPFSGACIRLIRVLSVPFVWSSNKRPMHYCSFSHFRCSSVGSVVFQMTGLSQVVSPFQARSALSGAGFTTEETEQIVATPGRQKIASILILLGNVGVVTGLGALVLSFSNGGGITVIYIIDGSLVLLGIACSHWLRDLTTPLIQCALATNFLFFVPC